MDRHFSFFWEPQSRNRRIIRVGRDLDDASAALGAEVWQRGADELDRPDQVGRDNVLDLLVGEFLRGTEQAVAGITDDDVDSS